MTNWTIADIPTLSDKLAIVTGSTGGLGFETALVLAQTEAEVLLTGPGELCQRAAGVATNHYPGRDRSFPQPARKMAVVCSN
jgi:NAD(P)-dependent dehydrogenase (short-subunit alcohol dehydrogenase family)